MSFHKQNFSEIYDEYHPKIVRYLTRLIDPVDPCRQAGFTTKVVQRAAYFHKHFLCRVQCKDQAASREG